MVGSRVSASKLTVTIRITCELIQVPKIGNEFNETKNRMKAVFGYLVLNESGSVWISSPQDLKWLTMTIHTIYNIGNMKTISKQPNSKKIPNNLTSFAAWNESFLN